MKYIAIIALAANIFLGSAAQAQDADATAKAESVAIQWLALTDSANYAASWDQSASLAKTIVAKADWESALEQTRSPLGTVKSRKLKSAQFTKSLPGAPDGEYVLIQFETQFEGKPDALETVAPMKEKDGSWRVSGYYIK
jgi:hypothetical protein